MVASTQYQETYITYLIKELKLRKDLLKDIETIYIGGGTPSHLDNNQLEKLLISIHKYINISNVKEFTIEANPIDINIDFINLIKKYQINRISLGVQSLNKKKLLILNRNHNKDIVIKSLQLLIDNNLKNINCDLIYGLKFDNFGLIKRDLRRLKKYVTHFSVYSLILEEKTVLFKKYQNNNLKLLNNKKEKKIYYKIINFLKHNNFNQYEISNFSIKGYESLHNKTYWDYDNYLGIGANSSSKIDNNRFTNINNIKSYYSGIDNNKLNYLEYLTLTEEEQIKEYIMLGFRKTEGINIMDFKERFNKGFLDLYPFTIDLINKNILIKDEDFIRINIDYFYVMNEIILRYI